MEGLNDKLPGTEKAIHNHSEYLDDRLKSGPGKTPSQKFASRFAVLKPHNSFQIYILYGL
jgi:hypothetical protein